MSQMKYPSQPRVLTPQEVAAAPTRLPPADKLHTGLWD
jgi:hypothetical protein